MSIASEILRIQQAKQAIKESINDKGGTLTNESIDDYAQAIDNLPSGGGGMTYQDYARTLYLAWGKSGIFPNAWQDLLLVDPLEISQNSTSGNPRGTVQYPNGETNGVIIPFEVTSIGDRAFQSWSTNNQILIISNSVTTIGSRAFATWSTNNQPLIIPDSVTTIGNYAFDQWSQNRQPLTIPDSVITIGDYAFSRWSLNNLPLTIPNSVTSIGSNAFWGWISATEFIMESETPPTITSDSFLNTNNALFYVPDASVDDYKTATNWASLASRIFSINDK